MTACGSNLRLDLIGCGARYSGGLQHSVAKVSWSTHPDGRAHCTFSTVNVADLCWRGEKMRDPATVTNRRGERLLRQDARGIWRHAAERPENLEGTTPRSEMESDA